MAFIKLVLVAAIACVPLAASAVETLDDSGLAAASGRDGIVIALDLDLTTDVVLHDTDGIGNELQPGYGHAGAVTIQDLSINATNATPGIADGIVVRIAVDDSDAGIPALNVDLQLPGMVTLETGTLGVANSRRDAGGGAGVTRGIDGAMTPWMDSAQIILGGASASLWLGREGDGARIRVYAEIVDGVVINNIALNDTNSGGTIGAGQVTLTDSGGSNLTVRADATVTEDAAVDIALAQVGNLANGMDIRIKRLYFGSVPAGYIGDLDILGLNFNGTTVAVSGRTRRL